MDTSLQKIENIIFQKKMFIFLIFLRVSGAWMTFCWFFFRLSFNSQIFQFFHKIIDRWDIFLHPCAIFCILNHHKITYTENCISNFSGLFASIIMSLSFKTNTAHAIAPKISYNLCKKLSYTPGKNVEISDHWMTFFWLLIFDDSSPFFACNFCL